MVILLIRTSLNILVQFSHSVVSDSLRPHGLQHSRPPCPSPTPGVYSNSYLLSQWFHPAISFSVIPFSSCLQSFPSIKVFSSESAFCIRWPKDWSFSFSISPSNDHSGPISLRMDWLDLLAVQGTLKNLLQHHTSYLHLYPDMAERRRARCLASSKASRVIHGNSSLMT